MNTKHDGVPFEVFYEWLCLNLFAKNGRFIQMNKTDKGKLKLKRFASLIFICFRRSRACRHTDSFGDSYSIFLSRTFLRALFGASFEAINNDFGVFFVKYESDHQMKKVAMDEHGEKIRKPKRNIAKGYCLFPRVEEILKKFNEDYENGLLEKTILDKVNKAKTKTKTPIMSKITRYEADENGKLVEVTTNAKNTHKDSNLPSVIEIDTDTCQEEYRFLTKILPPYCNYNKDLALQYEQDGTLSKIHDSLETDEERAKFDNHTKGAVTGSAEDIMAMFERLHRMMIAFMFADIVASNYGGLLMRYRESKNGRVYGIGSCNLQNMPRYVRKCLLRGCYDIDLENAHYTLLYCMAMTIGVELNGIKDYVDNKTEYRKRIAADLGLSVDTVKAALLALIFGSSTRKTFYDTVLKTTVNTALFDLLGEDKLKEFASHQSVKMLLDDIDQGGEAVILDYMNKSTKNGFINNMFGSAMSTKDSRTPETNKMASEFKRTALSHILQGAERCVLDIMIGSLDGSKVVLLQHDGLTYQGELTDTELKTIEANIQAVTGFDMKLSSDYLSIAA